MITAEQCKTYLEECKVLGSAPDISTRRATAVMAVCHAWSRSRVSLLSTNVF